MIQDNLKPQIHGHLKVEILENGKRTILYDDHNDIQAAVAETVIRNCISGYSTPLDYIAAYKAGGLLASKTLTEDYRTFTSTDAFTFLVLFDFEDFNDTLDEVRLGSSIEGVFSKVESLSIEKTNLQQLSISWKITISI